jgi:hypothetical protein
VDLHAYLSDLGIPLADTVNGQLGQLTDECVSEHLFRAAGDGGMFHSIINVTDQTDTHRLDNVDRLRRG